MKLLGVNITDVRWLGSHEIEVTFETARATLHQLYIGRTLAGFTTATGERTIHGQLKPEKTPPPLQILSVDGERVDVSYASVLPRRAYNRHRLQWTASGLDADTKRFEVRKAETPDTSPTVAVGSAEYFGDGSYEFETPALPCSGGWIFGVTGYDDTCGPDPITSGNEGTEATVTIPAQVMPPDVQLRSDGHRFGLAVSGGTATATIAYKV
jgi:hypothetical protein